MSVLQTCQTCRHPIWASQLRPCIALALCPPQLIESLLALSGSGRDSACARQSVVHYLYIYICIHTYIHTYIHAYIHTYIHEWPHLLRRCRTPEPRKVLRGGACGSAGPRRVLGWVLGRVLGWVLGRVLGWVLGRVLGRGRLGKCSS